MLATFNNSRCSTNSSSYYCNYHHHHRYLRVLASDRRLVLQKFLTFNSPLYNGNKCTYPVSFVGCQIVNVQPVLIMFLFFWLLFCLLVEIWWPLPLLSRCGLSEGESPFWSQEWMCYPHLNFRITQNKVIGSWKACDLNWMNDRHL